MTEKLAETQYSVHEFISRRWSIKFQRTTNLQQ
jgi:hypothetical protein